ncbi:MAG: oxidoreductase [Myxococcales bacterium]|nr:oxidoreductase [Myxococcales bacterium]MCB9641803.1 oxidoreductase [Myxococcales bacterium]
MSKKLGHAKTVLITGASSGMGKDFALRLLKEGYIVYGAARRVERMSDIVAAGGHALQMDVTSDESVQQGVQKMVQEQGRIDALINNAGYGSYGAIEDIPIDEARRQFEVNLFGLARITQLVLPHMRKQHAGKIINISSMGGKLYTPLGGWYNATKHALEGFSDCLRFETEQFGIDVVVIEPGSIESEWGGIAVDSAMKYSGQTAYAPLAQSFKSLSEGGSVRPSPPKVITDLVVKALRAKKPKTRYVAGAAAKPFMFLRRWVSDRAFDKILHRMMKSSS